MSDHRSIRESRMQKNINVIVDSIGEMDGCTISSNFVCPSSFSFGAPGARGASPKSIVNITVFGAMLPFSFTKQYLQSKQFVKEFERIRLRKFNWDRKATH